MQRLMIVFGWALVGLIAADGVQAQAKCGRVEAKGKCGSWTQLDKVEAARRWPRINDRLELRYTLEVGEEDQRVPVAATEGLESGDQFTMRVRPTEDAWLYLFVSDTEGEFRLVGPDLDDDGSLPGRVNGGSDVRLPPTTSLRLDDEPGVERLYLLASTERLREVEDLLEDDRRQVGEAWLIDLRDEHARNGTLTRQVRNEAVRVAYRQRGRGAAVVVETITIRHYRAN